MPAAPARRVMPRLSAGTRMFEDLERMSAVVHQAAFSA
jgi:hypothetical protein